MDYSDHFKKSSHGFLAVFTGYICVLRIVLWKGAQDSKQWPNDQRFFEGGGGGGFSKFSVSCI